MKKILNFLLGLTVLILVTSAAPASTMPVKAVNFNLKIDKSKLTKFKATDSYVFVVAYIITNVGTNTYDLKVTLLANDVTTHTYTPYPAPATLTVTMDAGPFSGGSFEIPSGDEVVDFGDFTFTTPPSGNIPATTSPLSLAGTAVVQELYDYADLP